MISPGEIINSLIVVGILSLKEDTENFRQGHHASAGYKAVPGKKAKTAIKDESLFLKIAVMVNEKIRQQGQQ